jgi:hypothetical protein
LSGDVKDFGALASSAHAGLVLFYDDTMPVYQIAAGLIAMTDAYQNRDSFGRREELDLWV